MNHGYMDCILDIDLSSGALTRKRLPTEMLRKYIGGAGLAAKILFDEATVDVDPLGPENRLILMTGPFVGTRIPTSGRLAVATRSPLTGIYAESDVGGTWGPALKHAGIDGLVIHGKASKPTYIWINDGEVTLRDASHVWGKDAYEMDDLLKTETDSRAVVLGIGPAGENLVRIASIMTDGKDGRAAGRCGVGAVMGSKNLKAIVAYGTQKVPLADEEALSQSIRAIVPDMVEKMKARSQYGTANWTLTADHIGDLPVKNWRGGAWEQGAEKLSGPAMAKSILTGRYFCGSCPIGCGRIVEVKQGKYSPVSGAGPEYETIGMLGSDCLVDDLEAVALGQELCNRYGMDSISAGAIIAFAMECYEHGLITSSDTGGVALDWGNADAMIEMLHQIGQRKHIGELLGEGTRRAAEKIGGIAPEFAVHVKGLELPAHDPRALNSTAVSYATSNRGACHLQSLSYPVEIALKMPELGYTEPLKPYVNEGKGELAAKMQDLMCLIDSLKVCKFIVTGGGGVQPSQLVSWLNMVTGWDVTLDEFLLTGERLFNLKRLYSVRLGISRKDDILPPRVLVHPRPDGGAAGNVPNLGQMLNDYYIHRGWDEIGRPLPETVARLKLS